MRKRSASSTKRLHLGYVRVSGFDQAHHGVSLDSQESRIVAHAAMRGIVLDEIVHDDGKSASSVAGRPGMRRILALVARGEVASVTCFKLDRAFRSVADMSAAVKLFEKHETAFVSVSDSIDTSCAAGRMMLNMLGVFAEFERDLAGERTAENLGRLRSQGRVYSKVTPYGYCAVDGTLVRDEDQQAVLARIVALAGEGVGPTAISRTLNAEGIVSPGGSHWYASSVASVLSTAAKAA